MTIDTFYRHFKNDLERMFERVPKRNKEGHLFVWKRRQMEK